MPMTKEYKMTAAGVAALVAQGSLFSGRTYRIEGENLVSYYGGNGDHAKMGAFAARYAVAVAAPVKTEGADLATPKQVAFLADLIDADFGTATTIGARITPTLTKAEASRLIDLMKAGV